MCYLDVAADAEGLPAGREERVQHLFGGGLYRLLRLLPLNTLRDKVWAGRGGANVKGVASGDGRVFWGGEAVATGGFSRGMKGVYFGAGGRGLFGA